MPTNEKQNIVQSIESQVLKSKKEVKFATPNIKQDKKLPVSISESIVQNGISKIESQPKVTENIVIDDSPEVPTSLANNLIFEDTSNTKPSADEQSSKELFKNDVGESVVLVLEPEKVEDELIPAINADSPIILADAKRLGQEKDENEKSFVVKLYGEYKNFKYGERVDFKKLGVKDVFARADESNLKSDFTDVRDYVQRRISRFQRKD